MIRKVRVENFKSIPNLSLELGRVNVLIGANGSGKSNILEAIALASAAAQNKLDNEFLISRGIRVTETRFMRSAFNRSPSLHEFNRISTKSDEGLNDGGYDHFAGKSIQILINGDKEVEFGCELFAGDLTSFPKLVQMGSPLQSEKLKLARELVALVESENLGSGSLQPPERRDRILAEINRIAELMKKVVELGTIPGFLIYAPENSALRTFQAEGQILPLGIKGEGLFAHLKGLNSKKHKDRLLKIKESLTLIDWFETFDIPDDLGPGERSIRIRDRFLTDGAAFDQRSANEGFLFLLFYITLFVSPETPAFFSIDNIDSSLNPKLCVELLRQLAILAKEHGKQVILTTHNPAILDGLDLHDDEQRLLVVDRNKEGHTRVRRVDPPKPVNGQAPVSMSEAFMRGYIGGLPKNF